MSYGGNADPSRDPGDVPGSDWGQVGQGGHRLQRAREPDHPEHHHQDELARDQPGRAADELLPRPQGGRPAPARKLDTGRGQCSRRRPSDRLPRGRGRPGSDETFRGPVDSAAASIRPCSNCDDTRRPSLRIRGTRQTMHQSPRIRRLRNDLAALERLRSESSVFRFTAHGDPPQQYQILFEGKSLWRDRGKSQSPRAAPSRDQAGCVVSADACPRFAG